MQIADRLTLTDLEVTGEGFLVAKATIARSGVQNYRAFELGITDGDWERVIRVFRPEDEVFADSSMKSFVRKPVTDGHPFENVTARNATNVTLGLTGETVTRDDNLVRTTITLFDAGAVDDVQRGRRQLSAGYSTDIDWTPGITADGEPFDAVQRNIRGNHIALVDAGRCGAECRIGDGRMRCSGASCSCGGRRVQDKPNLTTIIHDGISIEVTDEGARVIEKLKQSLSDAAARQAQAIAGKDKELGEKDAEIAKLTDAHLAPTDIDQLVAERTDVVARACSIADHVEIAGKSNADIRRAAVTARLGDDKVTGKSDDYVEALFDSLSTDADPLRDAIKNHQAPVSAGEAYRAYTLRLANAWKSKETH